MELSMELALAEKTAKLSPFTLLALGVGGEWASN
jgi:hypothetical protein